MVCILALKIRRGFSNEISIGVGVVVVNIAAQDGKVVLPISLAEEKSVPAKPP